MNLLNLHQAAMRLGISDQTMRKITSQIPSVTVGKRQKFRHDDIEAFILAGGSKSTGAAPCRIQG
jgi:hypothetical protein